MDPATVLEVLSMVLGGSVAGWGGVWWWGALKDRQAKRRERQARSTARWEPRHRRVGGTVVFDVVRVARWDGGEETVVEEDYEEPFVAPVGDMGARWDATANAIARADERNITDLTL